ncbi:hypothetical protein FHS26_006868 [Rhizobium pisi]|uniref:Uncharacterized protein n=1 Tax=Rhizobium pisi TaxID=574561 RepID=A0A427M5Y6_9HYPH|nr:hypothetical protein [Rhizobium pisi]MBB3139087.1 hypothetical protein [Rhizobium pisi]RSB59268.1 hypothetical protein EFD55_32760 [Rhizobium pisi]TCA40079.1 hypothetical protein E0J16_34990 [Rhizobium pisi]
MIPIAPISIFFYLLLLVSTISALLLVSWLAMLSVRRGARETFRAWLWFTLPIMMLLALSSTFVLSFVYQGYLVDADIKRDEAARNITLENPAVVAGIAMPAGTQLHSMRPGDREAFDAAHFPVPILINGLTATSLSRNLYPDLDTDTYAATSVEVILAFDQRVDGWLCGRGEPVAYKIEAAKIVFDSCVLGAANRLENWEIPVGAKLLAHAGSSRGWTIFLAPETMTTVRGLPLQGARIAVDRDRHFADFSEAVLATGLRLGVVTYPAGTRIRSKEWTSPGRDSDSLILSPVRGQLAKPDGQPDVLFGNSIVQTVAGQVLATLPNQKAGILDFEEITVDDPAD